jgi:hypothetical protein
MEANGAGLDRRIPLVFDSLAADEGESPERSHGRVETFACKC